MLEVEHYVPSSVRVSWVVRPYVEPSDDADEIAPQRADETEVPR